MVRANISVTARRTETLAWASLVVVFAVWAEANPPNNFGIFGQPTSSLLAPLMVGGTINLAAGWTAGLVVSDRPSGRLRPRDFGLLIAIVIGAALVQLAGQLAIVLVLEPDVVPRPRWQLAMNAATAAVFVVLGVLYALARDGLRQGSRERTLVLEAERLRRALLAREDTTVSLGAGRNAVRLPVSDIRYLQAAGNYVEVVTRERTHLIYGQLKTALDALPSNRFLRIHRSYVVALPEIRRFERGAVRLRDIALPVGPAYRASVRSALQSADGDFG